jgi:type I restriction-modification system DNA methylase subunit
MALFQSSVITKHLQNQNKENVAVKWEAFKNHFHNTKVQEEIKSLKEEQYQGEFLEDFFVKILGYTKPASSSETKFNLTTEYKNVKDSKKADGAIIINDVVKAVIELKGTNTTDLGKIEVQAFGYKNNQPECTYIITSNFEKLRFYIDNAIEYIEFNLFTLTEKEFNLLYLCLAYENIEKDIPKKIKEQSISQEDAITKKLYNDYSLFKRELHQNLVLLNPQFDALELFKKSQKLLDRFLFLFFAEDRQLLPPNSVRLILEKWESLNEFSDDYPLYGLFKNYFKALNTGRKGERYDIFAYNGGLFKPDTILDTIKIDNDLLYKHTKNLSEYDFDSEVDVNILGHIFENSLNELDEIKAQLEGEIIDKSKTKRKKEGVFYTPKYITKYIVENTVGKLCKEKKNELQIVEEEYIADKKRQKKTIKALIDKLTEYRNWLLQLTICDPACGSGAFLNQTLDFLINEHKYIDELQAKLFGDAMVMSDVEKSILENNLFGVDLNEESVEIAKLSLWLRTAQPNRKLNDLNNNIKCGNSLIDDVAIAGDKAFNWQKEFPQIFDKGGFDIIIGNPPYGAKLDQQTQSYLNKNYISGGSETVISFLKLSHDLLKEKGHLGFIIPKSFSFTSNYKPIREYLIKNITEIVDCGKVWSEVKLEQLIVQFTKSLNTDYYISSLRKDLEILKIGDISKKTFNEFGFLLNGISDEELKIGKKILNIGQFLNDISINQRGGSFQKEVSEKGDTFVLGGANIQRKGLSNFKGKINNSIVVSDKKNFINPNSVLVQNIVSHVQNPVEHIKIISCAPLILDENYVILDTINQISINSNYQSEIISALLNSKIINWFAYRFIFGKAIRTMHFDNAITERIPVPKIDDNTKTNLIDFIIKLEKTSLDISKIRSNFSDYFSEMLLLGKDIPKGLLEWDEINFNVFIKNINKLKKVDGLDYLSSEQEYKWFEIYTKKLKEINHLKKTNSELQTKIDFTFYNLFGLKEDEMTLILNQMPKYF